MGKRKGAELDERSERESEELYRTALTEAARMASFSVSKGFEESRQKTFGEF